VDSLAPARSALRPLASPNSFRRFPNGSSLPKEKENRPPFLKKTRDWIRRTIIRKTKTGQ
jgi:hypothetical protein